MWSNLGRKTDACSLGPKSERNDWLRKDGYGLGPPPSLFTALVFHLFPVRDQESKLGNHCKLVNLLKDKNLCKCVNKKYRNH